MRVVLLRLVVPRSLGPTLFMLDPMIVVVPRVVVPRSTAPIFPILNPNDSSSAEGSGTEKHGSNFGYAQSDNSSVGKQGSELFTRSF
jgi:hypothetical protein